MIKSLTIKNIATFNEEGVTINDLKQVNIIYGCNGSGKSTIAKVLANIDSYADSSISWINNRVVDVLVYNKDFRERNFSEQMPGVFTLGESGTTTIAEIDAKRKELQTVLSSKQGFESEIERQNITKEKEINNFRNAAWNDVFKKYEQWFPKSSIGAGTKEIFINKLKAAYDTNHTNIISEEELKTKSQVLFNKRPTRVEPYIPFDSSSLAELESDTIWAKVIEGKRDVNIARLIISLGNSDWVNKGVEYIKDGSDVCPFCQQHTITTDLRLQINKFFDETYRENINTINTKCENYKKEMDDLLNSLERFIKTQKTSEKTYTDIGRLETILNTLKATYANNLELITSKQKEPSRIVTLTKTSDIIGAFNTELTKANEEIATHNSMVDNLSKETADFISEIWKFFASQYKTSIAAHMRIISGTDSAIKNLTTKRDVETEKYKTIKNDIFHLENSITSVTPTVNEINRLLNGYGFTNFIIKEMEGNMNRYQIVRDNGEPANTTLSEGEATFITFLYYMQLAKGSFQPEGITNDRVLVIDDPVSSLDSNVLYVVSTLIRDAFTDIHEDKGAVKQVILFTHNVFFHKEVAFIDKHCKWKDNVKHLVLRKRNNVSSIQTYGKLNPIKSSYELLWTELKSRSQHSCIVVQNIMRRIIENYFQVLGGMSPDAILEKFDNPEERTICRTLLSWVNDGSHSLPDDLFVEMSDDQLDKNMKIFKDIFYKTGQDAHYEMMMQMKDMEDENISI